MDNLGNMKSLENCQIVCNNAALATGSQPGLQFPCGGYEAPRVERRGSSGRAGKISSRRATANIATAGIGSRLFILACYFPCLSACRASTLRFGCSKGERTDTYATLLSDPSNFSLFSHFIFAFLFAKQPPPRCLVYVETVSIVSTSFVFSSLFFPLSLIIEGRIYLDFSNEV